MFLNCLDFFGCAGKIIDPVPFPHVSAYPEVVLLNVLSLLPLNLN